MVRVRPTTLVGHPRTNHQSVMEYGGPTSPPRRTALLALKKSVRGDSVSLRFDTGSSDHLAPLLGFFSDQFAEIRGRSRKHSTPQLSKVNDRAVNGVPPNCFSRHC